MIKALLCDFYGTIVYENGPISYEVIKRVFKSGNAKTPEEIVAYWWEVFGQRMHDAFGDNHRRQYDLALVSFEDTLSHFQSGENARELCDLMVQHWCQPPIYEEARDFLACIKLPVYFVTNADDWFIEQAIAHYGLTPAGVITSEQAKSSKPRQEIFLYALNQIGLKSKEVVHIGDSLISDVTCPASVGISPIWLNREGKPVPEGVQAVSSLGEAVGIIQRMTV